MLQRNAILHVKYVYFPPDVMGSHSLLSVLKMPSREGGTSAGQSQSIPIKVYNTYFCGYSPHIF